ncbi:DoxX family membrane protein [Zhengella mangrovi]|uniref:DoxX family membrane protein n=1 Tax=Zhengella mangrovi TaxID=1982044 RepID=UPI00197C152D|nr:DoxX family membrane protein [Zhengella mangrovi]
MKTLVNPVVGIHAAVFSRIEAIGDRWLLGLLARGAFASVLLFYYWSSAATKIGPGLTGFLSIADGAYYQILPPVIESAGYDTANVALFPWKIIVVLGTYAEFVLPLLVVLGLFTRIAALGMIGFVAVQSFVDVVFHGIGAEATGAVFDRFPDAVIADQRLLWVFPLLYLVFKGAGRVSLDALLGRRTAPALPARATAAA